jgi:hypothetical protein
MPIPIWVQIGFVMSYKRIMEYKAESWDDVFGRAHKKGIHLESARKKREMMISVYMRVEQIRKEEPSTPIDDGLFERVSEELEIGGKTLAKECYYAIKKFLSNQQAKNKNSNKTV